MKYIKLLTFLAYVSLFSQCKQPSVTTQINSNPTRDNNLAMGNPDQAQPVTSNPNTYLVLRST